MLQSLTDAALRDGYGNMTRNLCTDECNIRLTPHQISIRIRVMTPRSLFFARWLELALVFGLLPLLIAAVGPRGLLFAALWLGFGACWWVLRKEPGYGFRDDWNAAALNRKAMGEVGLRFAFFAMLLTAFALYAVPGRLLSFPLERTPVWAMVMVLYPVLSVVPQEFIYRSFFLRRYRDLFRSPRVLALVSALAFGWAHVVMQNVVAVVFCAIGGVLFTHTYLKHRSLALCCFEHALYGCFVFTLGLGQFFYHGAMR